MNGIKWNEQKRSGKNRFPNHHPNDLKTFQIKPFRYLILLIWIGFSNSAFPQLITPDELEEFYLSSEFRVWNIKNIDEETVWVLFAQMDDDVMTHNYVTKMNMEGELLDLVEIPNLNYSGHKTFVKDDKLCIVSVQKAEECDTISPLCVLNVDQDMNLTCQRFDWDALDYGHSFDQSLYFKMVQVLFSKDGSLVLSYPVDSLWADNGNETMHLYRFNADGHTAAERILETRVLTRTNFLFSTPDSLGFRLILLNPNEIKYDCHTFDADLNTVSVIENIDRLSFPYFSCDEACNVVKFNPYNKRAYTNNYLTHLDNLYQPTDLFFSVFDEKMDQLNYTWGPSLPYNDIGTDIDFGVSGEEVFMLGSVDWPGLKSENDYKDFNNLYLGKFDADLNVISEVYFKTEMQLACNSLCACLDGSCLVCCERYDLYTQVLDYVVYRITPEDFLNVEVAHSHGLSLAIAYPNPGGNEMHIRTAVENAAVEVYDMNGRLVAQQPVTETETVLDATDWASGTYVWKVVSGVSALRQGSATLVETGKWVKE